MLRLRGPDVKRPVTDAAGRRHADVDDETLADLRYHIRRFLRGREMAARAAGIEPQQYLVLLQVKGLERRGPVTIGMLAERLPLHHHSTVELVDRLAKQGMVTRRRATLDRREVTVRLRARGEAILGQLVSQSVAELQTEGPELVSTLKRLISDRPVRPARGRVRTVEDARPVSTAAASRGGRRRSR
jgi:DNA-binding MarR family transcriptional regulator